MKARAIIFLVLALIGGAIAVDRLSPVSAAKRPGVALAPAAGILTCPVLTDPGGRAYLHLANVSSTKASVRVNVPVAKGKQSSFSLELAPLSVVTTALPNAVINRADAVIEYSGGVVVASHTLALRPVPSPINRGGGVAAASCARAGGADLVVGRAQTFNADARLVLVNPGSADADVSVSLLSDGRILRPQRLSRRVIPSHARRDFDLGDFAFNSHSLFALVHANAGRVVGEVLERRPDGVELIGGQDPSMSLVAISPQSGRTASIALGVIGEDDTGLDPRMINTAEPPTSTSVFPASLPPFANRVSLFPDQGHGGAAAFVINATVGSPIVASAQWVVARPSGRDIASLPAAAPATRWAAVAGAFDPASPTSVLIANPSDLPATVSLVVLGGKAPSSRALTLPPGRLSIIRIAKGAGVFAVSVTSNVPVVTALEDHVRSAKTLAVQAFAVIGVSVPGSVDVGVEIDPRVGVPAVFPTP